MQLEKRYYAKKPHANTAVDVISNRHLRFKLLQQYAVNVEGKFDLTDMLPADGKYATWEGSLTTAPCTEGVLWLSFLDPIGMDHTTVGMIHICS